MKLSEAEALIESASVGYLVHFERVEGPMLAGDYTPDIKAGEKPFAGYEAAWRFAARLADAMKGSAINFYVVNSRDFIPVPEYQKRMIVNR